ncbi:hypothetical protein [Klebsiella aerogenes]|uniref:Uncharacterized protein n=1 Tax=Klebsiella aerogenes TaxID=548 RepID=A0AAP9U6J2_KLEAE|nr:hypothetical protein [Klebsiella aerogenes]QMR41548.1 hypothetical protein HV331_19510 [Klebsiella aerogenes]
MKIIMMALLMWLLKLAVTLIISWAARERLKSAYFHERRSPNNGAFQGFFSQACGEPGWPHSR